MSRVSIGFLVFPGMLQLDFTGPYGVLAGGPGVGCHLVWKDKGMVMSSDGLPFTPTQSLHECPELDVLLVPGGAGVLPLLSDDAVLDFLRERSSQVRYLGSICTGALVLGAAGLLRGYAATTHWLSHDMLSWLGAKPRSERVVVDRDRISAAGVTSGIDMALTLAGLLWGDDAARAIPLNMEYSPSPPFAAGDPASAPEALVAAVRKDKSAVQAARLQAVRKAASKLGNG